MTTAILVLRCHLISANSYTTLSKSLITRVFNFYRLEDRILLSADTAGHDEPAWNADAQFIDSLLNQLLESESQDPASDQLGLAEPESTEPFSDHVAWAEFAPAPTLDEIRPIEVMIVDAGVEDAETLINGLRESSAEQTQWIVIRLSANQDGVAQISAALTDLTGVDAIHIVSHGNGDGVQLGSSWLDAQSMAGYASEITGWRAALDADADLLIYGCDLASTSNGRLLIESIAVLCDCDVAASDDVTGSNRMGGDWELEYTIGIVETQVAVTEFTQQTWSHLLAAENVTNAWTGTGPVSAVNSLADPIGVTATFTTPTGSNIIASTASMLTNNSFFSSPYVQGDPSLALNLRWDTSPESPSSDAADDSVASTITFVFDHTVENPILHIDRLGYYSGSISNSALWTLVTPDASLTKLAGVNHLEVTSNTFYRTPYVPTATNGEASADSATGSAAGSIQVNGVFNSLTFQIDGVGVEAGGGEVVEIAWELETAASLSVDTTADYLSSDANYGDTSSISALLMDKGADGLISLREAIDAANNTTGQNTISFAILNSDPGYTGTAGADGHWQISLVDALPTISNSVVIDATTQTVFAGDTNPGQLGVVSNVGTNDLSLAGVERPEIAVVGNPGIVGGFHINADNVTLRGFAISEFTNSGAAAVTLADGVSNVVLDSNVFGVSPTAISDPGVGNYNFRHIQSNGADNGFLTNNILAYSRSTGFLGGNGSDGWTIAGNQFIDSGYDYSNGDAIALIGAGGLIDRNYFSGSSTQAIIFAGVSNYTISNNTITNNGIGPVGSAPIQYDAVAIRSGSSSITITQNVIANNYGAGILVNDGASGVQISQNSFYGNGTVSSRNGSAPVGEIAIDLQASGENANVGTAPYVTANDAGDFDAGGNSLQNSPVITSAISDGNQVAISGTFHGESNQSFTIELYSSSSYFNGHGQGETYLDTVAVTTDGSGDATFSTVLNVHVDAEDFITATATHDLKGETSEFGAQFAINGPVHANTDNGHLEFDGTDDYVVIADSASLTMTNTLTMEAWVRPDTSTNVERLVINKEGEYELSIDADGSVKWAFANTDPGWSWHDTNAVLAVGQWAHVAVTYDNGVVSTFVNGQLIDVYQGSGVIGDAYITLDELRIGGRSNNPSGQYFEGAIDEVRIWNVARTQSEILSTINSSLAGTETGLVGDYTFDGLGTNVFDQSTAANHGVLGGGVSQPTRSIYMVTENGNLTIGVWEGLLANDIDLDGDGLLITEINGLSAGIGTTVTLASGATVQLNADGSFFYDSATLNNNLNPGDIASDSFTYTVTDSNGNSETATASVKVTGVNDAPTLPTNTGMTVVEGSSGTMISPAMLTAADSDDVDSQLTYTITDATDNGTLVLSGFGVLGLGDQFTQADLAAGNITYSHDDSETSNDSFGFVLTDGGEDGVLPIAGTFNIVVTLVDNNVIGPINDSDLATDTVAEDAVSGSTVGFTALAVDLDMGDSVTYSLDDDANGRFAINGSSGVLTVAGTLDFESSATENITVRATSTDGSTSTLDVTIAIADANEAPSAVGEDYSVLPGQTLSINGADVIFNDTDVDGDSLALILVAPPSNGAFTLQPGGSFTYTPNPNFFGQDSFFYQLTDGTLVSNTVQVTIEVPRALPAATSPPDPPSESSKPSDSPHQETESSDASEQESDPLRENVDQGTSADQTLAVVLATTENGSGKAPSRDTERASTASTDLIDLAPADLAIRESEAQFFQLSGSRETVGAVLSYSPQLEQLERLLREDLAQAIVWSHWDQRQTEEQTTAMVYAGVAGAGMSVFSIGYVFWALRGGALMTVFASSLPAWRFIDPISMLSAYRSAQNASEEGLESILNRGS